MRRFLRSGAWLLIACAASACTPSSTVPSGSNGGSSSGGGGTGGSLFGGGGTGGGSASCTDTSDADADSIGDALEGKKTDDADEDATPNYEDTDSDGDGWSDEKEATNPLLDRVGRRGHRRPGAPPALDGRHCRAPGRATRAAGAGQGPG